MGCGGQHGGSAQALSASQALADFLLFFGLYVAGTIAMLFDLATARSQEELVGISLPFVFVMVLCMALCCRVALVNGVVPEFNR